MVEKKVLAAIAGAMRASIDAERMIEEEPKVVAVPALPASRANVWGMAGRQEIMMQRRLWQMRLY
jgi:hypothetical protein